MEKSLLRAFLFSLAIFLVLNFLLFIIAYSMAELMESEIDRISDHPSHSIFLIVYPSRYFPWELFTNMADAGSFAFKLFFLGGFISFVIAAIVAGFMGGDIKKSLGGWFLTVICCIILHISILLIDDYNLIYIKFGITVVEGIVIILIAGLANVLIYGIIAFIIAFFFSRGS